MKFYFTELDDLQYDLLTDILFEEHIPFKLVASKNKSIGHVHFSSSFTLFCPMINDVKDICIDTSLEKFDFIKYLLDCRLRQFNKQQKIIDKLEDCLRLSTKKSTKSKRTCADLLNS